MSNKFSNVRIEFHILQSFPVTCLNRDDVGAPKTAIVGGATRARVSSQCWKRPVRLALHDFGGKLATRTKHTQEIFSTACQQAGATVVDADACGIKIAEALASDTLLFISDSEIAAFAEYAKGLNFNAESLKDKDLVKVAKKAINPAVDALDIALFGRMVAKAADMNVEAAASFAHAISTHRVSNEVEFFTALDDLQDVPGSAHMGSLEFNSATYYRYVSLDLGQLAQSIGVENVSKAVGIFVRALFVAIPNARQTTMSGAGQWDFARVLVRRGQRLQLSFDEPVKACGEGFIKPSIERIKADLDKKEKIAGSLSGKIGSYDIGDRENYSVDDLIADLQRHTG